MKNHSIFKVFSLAICFYAIVSCQKDEIISSSPTLNVKNLQPTPEQKQQLENLSNLEQKEDVISKKGRLVFKDLDAFKKVIGDLKALKNVGDLKKWSKKFNYTSLSETYDLKWKSAGFLSKKFCEENQMVFVPDLTFSFILNKDGIYQIGHEIQKITNEKGYAILEKNEELLKDLENINVRKYEIISEIIKLKKENNKNLRPSNFEGSISDFYTGPPDENGGDTYILLEAWNITYGGFYSSFGVRSMYNGPWTLDYIQAQAGGRWNLQSMIFGFDFDSDDFAAYDREYNSNYVDKTIKWYVAPTPWITAKFRIYGGAIGSAEYQGNKYSNGGWALGFGG